MNFNLEKHNPKALAILVGDVTEPVKSEIDLEGGETRGGPSQRMGEPGPGGAAQRGTVGPPQGRSLRLPWAPACGAALGEGGGRCQLGWDQALTQDGDAGAPFSEGLGAPARPPCRSGVSQP